MDLIIMTAAGVEKFQPQGPVLFIITFFTERQCWNRRKDGQMLHLPTGRQFPEVTETAKSSLFIYIFMNMHSNKTTLN